jgi:hypothetical protein
VKYLVLQVLPKGNQPGEIVELDDAVAHVFELVGAVRKVEDEPEPARSETHARRRYQRRDLSAESA